MNTPPIPPDLSSVAQLGVMISNAFPDSRSEAGATFRAIESVFATHPDCEAVQTVDVLSAAERREIRRLVHDQGRPHTYMLTRVFVEERLNLSSLDPELRRRSYAIAIQKFKDAGEAGASTVGVLSGARPVDPEKRQEALAVLEDSMAQLCRAGAADGLQVAIEPLDYAADKRGTLGTTDEAVAICRRLAESQLPLHLCLDTAHMLLNGEDVVASALAAESHVLEFHVCNAVIQREHALFGDRHLPFGPPGVLDAQAIGAILAALLRSGFLGLKKRRRVFSEVRKSADTNSPAVVAHGFETLQAAWRYAKERLANG